MRRLLVLLAVLALALGLTACGSDDSGDDSTAADTPSIDATVDSGDDTATQTTPANPRDTSVKPVIEKPAGSPPRHLVKEDIVRGKGPRAKKGDSVTMQYVGVSFSNGEQFDASWDNGAPFGPFQLGTGQVIAGLGQGHRGHARGRPPQARDPARAGLRVRRPGPDRTERDSDLRGRPRVDQLKLSAYATNAAPSTAIPA